MEWAALLGGVFQKTTGLCWTDFGGGVERHDRGQPHRAACRELAEELFSLAWKECGDKGAAKRVATAIMARCSAATGLGEEDFVRAHTFETPKGHYQ